MSTHFISTTPAPPYYAVSFTSVLTRLSSAYEKQAQRMLSLAQQEDGFLGVESVRDDKCGITISYWRDLDSIKHWQQQTEHLAAQEDGKKRWYDVFQVRISLVERDYHFEK